LAFCKKEYRKEWSSRPENKAKKNARQRDWWAGLTREEKDHRNKKRRDRNREKAEEMSRPCKTCGELIFSINPKKEYCGRGVCKLGTKKKCPQCEKYFFSKNPKRDKFCSRECWIASKKGVPVSGSSGSFISCEWCGEEFYAIPSEKRKFCNPSCHISFQRETGKRSKKKKLKVIEPVVCSVCQSQTMNLRTGLCDPCKETRKFFTGVCQKLKDKTRHQCPYRRKFEGIASGMRRRTRSTGMGRAKGGFLKAASYLRDKTTRKCPYRKKFNNLASNMRKRSRMKEDGGYVTPKQLEEKFEKQNGLCALSGISLTPSDVSADHIVPYESGGENTIENVEIVHKQINRMKGTLSRGEFILYCTLVAKNHLNY
jgi:5-methylcytosine-specific restriction endonuclease McrA